MSHEVTWTMSLAWGPILDIGHCVLNSSYKLWIFQIYYWRGYFDKLLQGGNSCTHPLKIVEECWDTSISFLLLEVFVTWRAYISFLLSIEGPKVDSLTNLYQVKVIWRIWLWGILKMVQCKWATQGVGWPEYNRRTLYEACHCSIAYCEIPKW
jgi:hypothetical protein